MTAFPSSIGFPAGVFGEAPVRLEVVAHGPGWVALNKPVNLPGDDHPWQKNAAHLVGELRLQLQLGKPEMARLGLKEPAVAFSPEPEVSGLLILADRATTLAAWREAIGSFQLGFTYDFIARTEDAPPEGGLCDLPLGMDDERGRAFISHRLGKQAETTFQGGETFNRWRRWTATTRFPRRDQIRAHANECGLRIAGELQYARSGRVTLTDTTRRGRLNKGEDKPLHRCLLLHLGRLQGNVGGVPVDLTAPLPDDFATVVKRLGKAA
jgi:hypothetical protein